MPTRWVAVGSQGAPVCPTALVLEGVDVFAVGHLFGGPAGIRARLIRRYLGDGAGLHARGVGVRTASALSGCTQRGNSPRRRPGVVNARRIEGQSVGIGQFVIDADGAVLRNISRPGGTHQDHRPGDHHKRQSVTSNREERRSNPHSHPQFKKPHPSTTERPGATRPCGCTTPKLPRSHKIAHAHPNRKHENQVLNPIIIIVMKKASPQSGNLPVTVKWVKRPHPVGETALAARGKCACSVNRRWAGTKLNCDIAQVR
jgi:hypothetical protein